MSSESPAAELYSSDGYEISVQNNVLTPTGTRGIIAAGSDGTSTRFFKTDASGNQIVVGLGAAGTPAGGVLSVQGVSGMTALTVNNATAANLLANVGGLAAAGSASAGNPVWIAGNVTTAVPAYANNTINALSITTGGLLRIDGVYPVTTVSTTATDMMQVGGAITTSAPSYSTATTNALSLNTTGDLRVIGKVTDGTNIAAVKAASTAAVATDPALVVAISPNNSLGITTNDLVTTSTALGALNATVALAVPGARNAGFQLAAGTLVGTLVPEISIDGGTTWVQTFFDDPTTSNITSSLVFGSANTAVTRSIVGSGGASNVRIRVSAYTSGTANGIVRATTLLDPTILYGGAAGSTLAPIVAQVGGSVTTAAPAYTTVTMNALSLTTAGDLRVTGKVTDGTNTAAVKAASTAAVATDPALVVAISPNNIVSTTTGDITATGALGALNAAVQVNTAGLETVGLQLAAGTLIGTILSEVSFDGGTTWNSTYFDTPAGGKIATIVFASANTATSATIVGVGGSGLSRVRVSAYTSGTANVTVRATTRTDPSVLFTNPVGSSTAPPDMAYVGGAVTTAAPTYTTGTINVLSLDVAGDLRTLGKVTDGTNTAAVKAASTAAVATDPALVVSLSPNSHIKSTAQPLYGTSGQIITITLTGLVSAAARASTAIDNTTNLYEDVLLFFKMATNTTGVSATGYINVYGYGSVDNGTTYPEGITGTDAGVTLTTPPNLVLIAQINANVVSQTKTFGPVSFCRLYGLDKLPAKWGVVVVNETGAAFTATTGNYAVTYQGINGQLV